MILRATTIAALLSALARVSADPAPEITTLAEGYNYIAKLPCIDCPFLHRGTADGPWTKQIEDSALLLNISLPWDATHLSVNSASLLTHSTTQPRIYAAQVPQDYSTEDLTRSISDHGLSAAGPLLGLSYGTSLHHMPNSTALVYRFNVFAAKFPLSDPPISFPLDASDQKVLELVFLPRPLQSPADMFPGWEIVSVRLSARERSGSKHRMRIMLFDEWDEFGQKGSPWHLIASSSGSLVAYAARGVWQLGLAILGILVVFVAVVVAGVIWCEGKDEVFKTKEEKSRRGPSGSWKDVEWGRLDGSVGVGKSD